VSVSLYSFYKRAEQGAISETTKPIDNAQAFKKQAQKE
jgi:hypothetical protein